MIKTSRIRKKTQAQPLRFAPIFDARVWGGRCFESAFGRILPDGKKYGESREICDRADAESVAVGGRFDGMNIRDILKSHAAEIMGPKWDSGKRFPLIVKWLDCRQRLSLQVHPADCAAKKFGGEKKNEAWYFYKCEKGSKYVAGLRENMTGEKLVEDIKKSTLEKGVVFHKSNAGDFVFIPEGCVHAIGAGNLVLEIQENSDTTYRLYDWGRLDSNGKSRELHLDRALESADFSIKAPLPLYENEEKIRKLCKYRSFSISLVKLSKGESFCVRAHSQARLLTLLQGKFSGIDIVKFETVLLPYADGFKFVAEEDAKFILTENFSR